MNDKYAPQTTDVVRMRQALDKGARDRSFEPVLNGIRETLKCHGIECDRIQIPMTKALGFRHPRYSSVILTWRKSNGFDDTLLLVHPPLEYKNETAVPSLSIDYIPPSPYRVALSSTSFALNIDLNETELSFDVLDELKDQGMRYYCIFKLDLPATHRPAMMSLAAASPFPDDLVSRLQSLSDLFALTLYGAYRTSQAMEVASAYLGQETGQKVLDGEITRGAFQTIHAGILFCDVRGFTALSEGLGRRIIAVMNDVFDEIGGAIHDEGGEILKFIGDAILAVFPIGENTVKDVAYAVIRTMENALERIELLAQNLKLEVSVGFGAHIGDVIYGNIGSSNRLDFTVMGPAVNLTSRLESLCKPLSVNVLVSQEIQRHVDHLVSMGSHQLKGISKPTDVWTLPPNRQSIRTNDV